MEKKLLGILFLFVIGVGIKINAQIAENSWAFGFGAVYPKFISITTTSVERSNNFGGFLSLRRDFNEHISLRLKASYLKMKSLDYKNFSPTNWIYETTNAFTADVDLIYNFVPCSFIAPYAMLGFGMINYDVNNAPTPSREGNHFDYQMNLGLGVLWKINSDWGLRAEINYHTVNDNSLEGNSEFDEIKGILGSNGDTYMTFSLGALYYFSQGEQSTLCNPLPSGLKEVIKEVPVEVEKIVVDTVYVQKTPYQRKMVLFGVNFEFDSATLRVESYPILENVIQELKEYPDVRIEIQGFTDSIGPELYNLRLSKRRAETVKKFLVSHGIDASRIYVKGMGESHPIKSNATKIGRAFNRRIEFKVYGKRDIK